MVGVEFSNSLIIVMFTFLMVYRVILFRGRVILSMTIRTKPYMLGIDP